MSETDARASALAVVQRALDEQPELLIAQQFLGMLVPDALAPLREQSAQLVERILSVPTAPEPAYARPARAPQTGRRPSQVTTLVDVGIRPQTPQARRARERNAYRELAAGTAARDKSPRDPETGRTLFQMWMENEIQANTPEELARIMGWSGDDSRAEGFAG